MNPNQHSRQLRWLGLIAGPVMALLSYWLLPHQYQSLSGETVIFAASGRATIAIMIWMAIWWLSEVIDVAATALLPIVLFPLLGISDIKTTTAAYASDLIFLFLGGFIIALAFQRWGLDQRIALLTLRWVGTRPDNMVLGFMLATAALSAFVSNTATAAMMLPIALSVIDLVLRQNNAAGLRQSGELDLSIDAPGRNFALCLLLGIAYGASIGGIATIIGTPPNLFLVSFIKDSIAEPFRQEISFLRWMSIGVPLAVLLLPLTWWLLTRLLYPIRIQQIPGGQQLVREHYQQLGVVNHGEKVTIIIFLLTAAAWMSRPYLPVDGLSDAGIAITAALLLFLIPVKNHNGHYQCVMNWETAKKLPWGILLLFGGGLSLASAVKNNQVAEFIGAQAISFSHWPSLAILLVVVTAVVFLTELTSNTATTATLVPILAALAPGLDLHPYQLAIPAAIAASCAFMMPVATPPNAIVFGSGYISIAQMCRAGFWLNLVAIAAITLLVPYLMLSLLE